VHRAHLARKNPLRLGPLLGIDQPDVQCARADRSLQLGRGALGDHPAVGDVRGRGLLAGIEFVEDKASRRPFPATARFAESFATAALDLGLTVWPNSGQLEDGTGDLAMLAPPFVVTEEQIDEMVKVCSRAVEEAAAGVAAGR
jgi:adenosylmethionine-8-amino-7-oxononanoate aminotransferase